MAARLVVRALAPQGMGRALAPVGGAAPLSPPRILSSLNQEEHTKEKRENRRTEYRKRNPLLRKTISLTRKKYFSN